MRSRVALVDCRRELAGEILDRSENAASDDVAFQPRKSDLNLIEPVRIGGRELKLRVRISLQEILDLAGLVIGQIVENDVNLLVRFTTGDHLLEEVDKFRAGMPLGGLVQHSPVTSSAA